MFPKKSNISSEGSLILTHLQEVLFTDATNSLAGLVCNSLFSLLTYMRLLLKASSDSSLSSASWKIVSFWIFSFPRHLPDLFPQQRPVIQTYKCWPLDWKLWRHNMLFSCVFQSTYLSGEFFTHQSIYLFVLTHWEFLLMNERPLCFRKTITMQPKIQNSENTTHSQKYGI